MGAGSGRPGAVGAGKGTGRPGPGVGGRVGGGGSGVVTASGAGRVLQRIRAVGAAAGVHAWPEGCRKRKRRPQ